ncbi:MAG: hypothetical protein IJH39_01580 [Clostridia bacterium]|nr:hypothetical protein [Clostridia bacterium]
MNDEKRIKSLRIANLLVTAILMGVTVMFMIVTFEPLRHTIMSSCVLLLLTITLVFDGILKDKKQMMSHSIWYVLWFSNLIITLFKF